MMHSKCMSVRSQTDHRLVAQSFVELSVLIQAVFSPPGVTLHAHIQDRLHNDACKAGMARVVIRTGDIKRSVYASIDIL